ncbi:leucine-rich repeat protein [Butyrivibrio sp. DSM 10294]|uniref:leucine-rich repeat protein n=1 Tax=Butyrivibrio sp. DSM 10294 TaxID=2972457 RepID=UPI00234E6DCF|nr:leucine-rich repeat protein [Butyrivibrio sp. DSM 10294]MDC7292784.1 leucine-rich repeat protein [Butyrivibrio sp. DSM 10294]
MRKVLRKGLSAVLAASLLFTSIDVTAIAANPQEKEQEIMVLDEEQEKALEEKLKGAVSEDEHPNGVFGFYETILNATEGDEVVVSVVRQGNTDNKATVVFKAVDVSAEYGKDYTISIEQGLFGDKDLPSADGVRPLVEEYGEIATEDDVNSFITVEKNENGEANFNSSDVEEEITEEESEFDSENTDTSVTISDEGKTADTNDAAGTDIAADTNAAADVISEAEAETIEVVSEEEEGNAKFDAKEEETVNNTSSYLGGTNSLGNLYSLQTGEEAPNYDWKEYAEEEVSEETKEAMSAGYDESRENLASLPGVTAKLEFAEGEYKKDIKVKIKDDEKSESGEVVLFVLQDAEGAEIGSSYNGYLNISDNDNHEALAYSVKEKEIVITPDDYLAQVTILRHSGIDQMDFVSVGTQGIDAEPDVDYKKTVTELFFAAGVTERTVEIPIISDRSKEAHFWVGLTSANGSVSGNNACYVTIQEDPDFETRFNTASEESSDDTAEFNSSVANLEANSAGTEEVVVYQNSSENSTGRKDYAYKVLDNIDISSADYVEVKYKVWGYTYRWLINDDREKAVHLYLRGKGFKYSIEDEHYKFFQPPSSDPGRVESYTHRWTRSKDKNWYYKDAEVWYQFYPEDGTKSGDVHITIEKVVVGYNKYKFAINNNYNGMGQYREKAYKAINSSDDGRTIDYQKAYFNDKSGNQTSEITIRSGETVSTSREAKGSTANSLGVYAQDSTVDFKGFKLVKPNVRNKVSDDILPATFVVDNAFKTKYRDYMYSDGTFELVPVYEPKKVTIIFNNENASASGKADVKGRISGFNNGAELEATMLDTLNVSAVANEGYAVDNIALEKYITERVYNEKVHGEAISSDNDKYVVAADNLKTSNPNLLVSPLNYETKKNLRLTVNYDASSITLAPNPQSKNNASNGKILYVDSVVTDDTTSDTGKMVNGGDSLSIEGVAINKAYTFGSLPQSEGNYHTFWKDGTLDNDGDGIVNDDNPFYKSFKNSYGQTIRYVTKLPKSKIYYNFVTEPDVAAELNPVPIRGWIKIKDKLLISGSETTMGLNGIEVYSDGIEATTKNGGYGSKIGDGYYELDERHFYDLFTYSVTFNGNTPYGEVYSMAVQNPGINEDIVIETWKDVDITDVRLFEKEKNKNGEYEYKAVDTSSAKTGYFEAFTDGDYDYRIQMTAHRSGVNIDKAEMAFINKDGSSVAIIGKEDGNHSGIFTFDFNPAKQFIKAGAIARVTFSSGASKFLSRDVGIKIRASLGVIKIVNFFVGDTSTARIDIIGAVNSAFDLGWTGNVDKATKGSNAYEDEEKNKVIKVGFSKNIVDKATKDTMKEAANDAADAAKAVGKTNSEIAKLESKLSKANESQKKELESKIAESKKKLEENKKEAEEKKKEFDKVLAGAQEPQKNKPKFGNSFTMDLGFSFLMTCGYDSNVDEWYFKNLILTATVDADYKFTMNYATPIGVTIGIGLELEVKAGASFVIEQQNDTDSAKRYYIKANQDVNVIEADSSAYGSNLAKNGLFSIDPSITLTLSAGIAGNLVSVSVSGKAAFNMVFGTGTDSAGACTLSASIGVSIIGFSFKKELASKTYQLWGDEETLNFGAAYGDKIVKALGEASSSLLSESINEFKADDVSYMDDGYEWLGGDESESVFNAIDEGGMGAYRESPLADKISNNPEFNMVSLGDGKFAAVFLNPPKNRVNDENNRYAAYYTYYDGASWSLPEILEDDGALDQYPRIYSLGSRPGALIVWSSVNTEYKDTDNKLERLNALDIHGRFISKDGTLSDIQEITKTTTDKNAAETGLEISDKSADRMFGIFSANDKLVVCYEKRQYANKTSDEAEVGDMIYPVSSLIAVRTYDYNENTWAQGTESLDSLPGLMALGTKAAQERLKTYNENVYGQKFLDYLPGVILKEDLGDNGYYRSGGSGTTAIKLEDKTKGFLLESDARITTISGKDYGVVAYTVDADGDMNTLSDRQLYMVTYDMDKGEFDEPVILTGYEINSLTGEAYTPESSNPRLLNANGALYVLWLRKENILGLNVSNLIVNEEQLIKTGTEDGISYRYVDKSEPTSKEKAFYSNPKYIVQGRIADTEDTTGEVTGDIHQFDAATDGKYIYVLWPEASENEQEDAQDSLIDTQLWAVRVETAGDESNPESCGRLSYTTLPVQVTSYPENNFDDITFDVVDGRMVGLARKVPSRLIKESEARELYGDSYSSETFVPYAVWDDSEAYPVSFWVDPKSVARIKNAAINDAVAGEGANFSFEVLNDGFDYLKGAKVIATDINGNKLLEEEVAKESGLTGGERFAFAGHLPLDKSATDADVFITLTTKDGESITTTLHKDLAPDFSIMNLSVVETGIRGLYNVKGTAFNNGDSTSEAGSMQIYVKKDGNIRSLDRVSYPSLAPGESYEIDTLIDVTDEDFEKSVLGVDMATGEVIEEDVDGQGKDIGFEITETLNLYASYIDDDETIEKPIYHEAADEEEAQEFVTRFADAQEERYVDKATGVVVEAVKAVDKNGETTAEPVSAGKGLIILEKGEKVNLRTTIESSLASDAVARDEDGTELAKKTGAENLTYNYEFIGDEGEFDEDCWFKANKVGTGKLKVNVYPSDREFGAENYTRLGTDTLDGTYSFARVANGEYTDTYADFPADAIKTFTLDVEVVDEGERGNNEDQVYFKDSKGFTYRIIKNNEVAVCALDKEKHLTSISIPATVKNAGKTYKVTRIDANTFMENTDLKTVTIGKNVKEIRSNAFSNCTSLTKVTFGSGLEIIDDQAFKGCYLLKSFTLPSKLKKINDEAFMDCISIKAVTIPANVIYIGEKAFYGCLGLTTITIKANNLTADQIGRNTFGNINELAVFKFSMKNKTIKEQLTDALTDDGELFADKKGITYKVMSFDQKTVSVTGLTENTKLKLKSVTIPATVEYKGEKYSVVSVEKNAFEGNGKLTAVSFPKSVSAIKDGAFKDCTALKNIKLLATLLKVGNEAFSGCSALKQVNIAGADTKFGTAVFDGVPYAAVFKLTSKNQTTKERIIGSIIGNTKTFVDSKNNNYTILSFVNREVSYNGNKTNIKSVNVPDKVKFRGAEFFVVEVSDNAFKDNNVITSVSLGKNVYEVGEAAFSGCTSLKKVTMKNVITIDNDAFYGCSQLGNVTFANATEYIGESSFENCIALKNVTILRDARTIDDKAFYNCSSLKKVTIKSQYLVEVGIDAFSGNHAQATYKISNKKKYDDYKKILTEAGVDAAKIKK